MSNINITRGTTDTADNVRYRDMVAPATDYKGIALLTGALLGVITLLWLIILAVAGISCWWNNQYNCTAQNYVFWGYIIIITIGALIAVFSAVPFIYQRVINSKFMQMRGIILHRDSIRENAPDLIAVAHESAKSEATAGIDNYAPTFSRTQTVTAPAIPPVLEASLADDGGDIPMEAFIQEANK